MRTFGLIPAAGKSRRMGQPKLLLPLGDATVLERVVAAVRAAAVPEIVVVVAPDGDEIARIATAAGAFVVRLAEDTPDMRATVMHGLAWIAERFRPRDDDGWLLLPADHPTVRSEVVRAVLSAADEGMIVVPTNGGRRGHPTWFGWPHVGGLAAFPPDVGLNAYIRAHAEQTREVPWPDAEILRDLDTPEDYQALLRQT
ncbi:MAG TPA: nucleotidyltransferase family protein [Gemmataceae bacterium]|nr:nucleotidyltransferase family protein [Gemmataceae bacterium]